MRGNVMLLLTLLDWYRIVRTLPPTHRPSPRAYGRSTIGTTSVRTARSRAPEAGSVRPRRARLRGPRGRRQAPTPSSPPSPARRAVRRVSADRPRAHRGWRCGRRRVSRGATRTRCRGGNYRPAVHGEGPCVTGCDPRPRSRLRVGREACLRGVPPCRQGIPAGRARSWRARGGSFRRGLPRRGRAVPCRCPASSRR